MIKKIMVPSGIGDFSWTWAKLAATDDQYHIHFANGLPNRMDAFLALLPKDKVLSYKMSEEFTTGWDGPTLKPYPREKRQPIKVARNYTDLNDQEFKFFECNSFLEAGNRLEYWQKNELPKIDFHYNIKGVVDGAKTGNYFIVNFSSYGTKKAWGYYEVDDSADIVEYISKKKEMMPVFIGGSYDDYTTDIFKTVVSRGVRAVSLVGKTPDLIAVIALLQQARMYFGACSGLMALANVLYTPVAVYYPPFDMPPGRLLNGMWHDPEVLHVGMTWRGKMGDIVRLEKECLNNI